MPVEFIHPSGRRGAPRRWRWRRRGIRPALVLFALLGAGLAQAQPASPGFSGEEQALIERNASLRVLAATAPAAARRALDAILAARPAGTARDRLPAAPEPRPAAPGGDFDAATDPDLDALQRVSPEAAHDVFQILKQVGSAKPAVVPR